mmetsp:Transcript_2591/g.7981  ORF Transcript_2591/g.7981 Transcript_2591/m.7981 type:complete len:256 (+) Transcript_2591:624-1391(+)
MRRGATQRAQDAPHGMFPRVRRLLRLGEVVSLQHPAGGLGVGHDVPAAHVHPEDALGLYPQLPQAASDHLPALRVVGHVQHVDPHVHPQPLARHGALNRRPVSGSAVAGPVADLRVFERFESPFSRRHRPAEVRPHGLERAPGEVRLQVRVAHGLEADPTPVPVVRVLPGEVVLVLELALRQRRGVKPPFALPVHPGHPQLGVAHLRLQLRRGYAPPLPEPRRPAISDLLDDAPGGQNGAEETSDRDSAKPSPMA